MRVDAVVLQSLLDLDLMRSGCDFADEAYPGMSPKQFAMLSLRKSLLKKFEDDSNRDADIAAVALFVENNERCKGFAFPDLSEAETIALGEARQFIDNFFQEDGSYIVDGMSILDGCGFGPGASLGSPTQSLFSKIANSELTYTNETLPILYRQAISTDPLLSAVESSRAKGRSCSMVKGSRVSTVPKNRNISRTICTEPLLNMFFQKGIESVIRRRLIEVCGIDLSRQPDINRSMCRIGSETGKFGTIDLSSASDTIALELVRWLVPKPVFNWLWLTRSPYTILPDGRAVELHMVSSMGNAFTFPLQTLLFYAIVYGAYRVLGITPRRSSRLSLGNIAVFGDDIIVVREAFGFVTKMLSICGFSVNVDKSFNEGLFRESCGRDYYNGCNVRGVYIRTLKTDSSRYSAINRLNRWSAEWGISLSETVNYLLSTVRFLPIPFDEMDDGGVKVPLSLVKRVRYCRRTRGVLYRVLVSKTRSYDMTDCESRPPRHLKGYFDNPAGVVAAAIAGTLRSGLLVLPSQVSKPSIKVRSSSRWDWILPGSEFSPDFGERWKFFTALNLLK